MKGVALAGLIVLSFAEPPRIVAAAEPQSAPVSLEALRGLDADCRKGGFDLERVTWSGAYAPDVMLPRVGGPEVGGMLQLYFACKGSCQFFHGAGQAQAAARKQCDELGRFDASAVAAFQPNADAVAACKTYLAGTGLRLSAENTAAACAAWIEGLRDGDVKKMCAKAASLGLFPPGQEGDCPSSLAAVEGRPESCGSSSAGDAGLLCKAQAGWLAALRSSGKPPVCSAYLTRANQAFCRQAAEELSQLSARKRREQQAGKPKQNSPEVLREIKAKADEDIRKARAEEKVRLAQADKERKAKAAEEVRLAKAQEAVRLKAQQEAHALAEAAKKSKTQFRKGQSMEMISPELAKEMKKKKIPVPVEPPHDKPEEPHVQ